MRTLPILSALLLALPLAAQQRATVGQSVPDVTFPLLLNGDGRLSLSEFLGQPVMIEQWGRN